MGIWGTNAALIRGHKAGEERVTVAKETGLNVGVMVGVAVRVGVRIWVELWLLVGMGVCVEVVEGFSDRTVIVEVSAGVPEIGVITPEQPKRMPSWIR